MAETRVAETYVPVNFTPYLQQQTAVKSELVRAGAVVLDPMLSGMLAGRGSVFDIPSWQDIPDDADNVCGDDPAVTSTPNDLATSVERAIRLCRNQSWKNMRLMLDLAGPGVDAWTHIGNRVSDYWTRALQNAVIATMAGVFADNDAAPTGTEHTAGDLTLDVSGSSYSAGVTDFTATNFINACLKMGDAEQALGIACMHSVVYARARKNNLIDFIPDSINGQAVQVPTFLGRRVIQDDRMPSTGNVYQTWILGEGAVRWGQNAPEFANEMDRKPEEGNGRGSDILYSRTEWMIHPVGHRFAVASPAAGGPSNASTSGNLAHADSWARVYPERKQIKIVRLITREA